MYSICTNMYRRWTRKRMFTPASYRRWTTERMSTPASYRRWTRERLSTPASNKPATELLLSNPRVSYHNERLFTRSDSSQTRSEFTALVKVGSTGNESRLPVVQFSLQLSSALIHTCRQTRSNMYCNVNIFIVNIYILNIYL